MYSALELCNTGTSQLFGVFQNRQDPPSGNC
jgi:hypothetical protein